MAGQRYNKAVTQRDVAQLAGVSSSVVSYVINGGPRYVAEDTRQRVLEAIEQLGYRPNKFAQGLRSESHHAARQVGVIIGGSSDHFKRPYFGAILAGLYNEVQRQQRRIRFIHFLDELQDPVLFNEHIHPEEISELILMSVDLAREDAQYEYLLERISQRIEHIVCLERSVLHFPTVIVDRVEAAHKAVQHLISLGHRHIGYIGTDDERVEGYTHALLINGLECRPAWLNLIQRMPPEGSYQTATAFFDTRPEVTAIFASSDSTAIGVIAALKDQGLRVPEDIAIVSIDDLPVASMIRPALTTVHVPKELIGAYGLRMLKTMSDSTDEEPVSMVLPTRLIVRQSCGSQLQLENKQEK